MQAIALKRFKSIALGGKSGDVGEVLLNGYEVEHSFTQDADGLHTSFGEQVALQMGSELAIEFGEHA